MEQEPETIFYDGECALCHGAVKFIIARDRQARFVFAPLGGATFVRLLGRAPACGSTDQPTEGPPDSIVVCRNDGSTLVRSAAVLHILERLGGAWWALARLARVVPRPVRDWCYDRVAAVRRRWFGAASGACPLVPPERRDRLRA